MGLPFLKHRHILLFFVLGVFLAVGVPQQGVTQLATPAAQVQQGVDQYEAGDFQAAIASWQTALAAYQESGNQLNQAIAAENIARAYRRVGNDAEALPYWQQTAALYAQLQRPAKLGRMLTEKAQTYTSLGQYSQAAGLLCAVASDGPGHDQPPCRADSAIGLARQEGDGLGEAAALGSLGEVYRLQGRSEWAEATLSQSLEKARATNQGTYQAAANMSLGSLHLQRARASDRRAAGALQRGDDAAALRQQAEDENQAAIGFFEAGLSAADTPRQLKILLNLIPARHRAQDLSAAQANYRQAIALLDQLPPSRSKAYATIDLATLLPLTLSLELPRQSLSGTVCPSIDLPAPIRAQTENLLQRAIATAQVTGDYRAQSFAYGKLGHLYECDLRYEKALAFTQDAEWAADQALESYDSLYLWQWQTGRILRQKAAQDDAIASYEAAATTLKKIRSDILTAERDLQFDFRDAVEPLYRELVELRLAQATTSQTGPDDTNESATASGEGDPADDIGAALITIDELRLAELQNYFGDECLILASVDADEAEEAAGASYPNTGIFSTFITDDRTAVVLTLPDGQRRVEWLSQGERQINELVNRFRLSLEESLNFPDTYDPNVPGPNSVNAAFNPSLSATLYEKLIRPFAADLASAKDVKTLVFIQDGIFRSIPMGALYDRESKRYLIQDYAIATTPSLSLTPSPTRRRRLRALALGLSEQATVEDEDFRALEGVSVELNQIEEQLPGSKRLLNADFTFNRLRQALREEEYSIVHMATHGEFGAEPEDTFLVTGDTDDTGKNKKLTIGDLEQALRQSGGTQQIDVLTLTACKTAIGDDRSTLGLAGVAVQAGARSAVASLWSIEDFSTATIINDFYGFLKDPNLSKAKALQSAQVAALTSNDSNLSKPGYWAPFLLIGDWQ